MKTLKFSIYHPQDPSVGLFPIHENITVTIESGELLEDEPGDFAKELGEWLADWYEGAEVNNE